MTWTKDTSVALVPGAQLPGRTTREKAQVGVDSLNKHLAAGDVTVSPTFEVQVTPAGREAAIREAALLFGECRKVTDVRASWQGMFVDTEELCESAPPTSKDAGTARSEGVQGGANEESGQVVAASDEWFECALTVFGAALSIWAFIKTEPWSSGYWWQIAAAAVTIYLALRSCYSVWGVWIEKYDGWGTASDYYYGWRYSGTYGWLPGGQDSYTSNSFWWGT